jgi:hypothetical protein
MREDSMTDREPKRVPVTDSHKLTEITCIFAAIDACLEAYFDREEPVRDNSGLGLVMAIEHLNNKIGRLTGAI